MDSLQKDEHRWSGIVYVFLSLLVTAGIFFYLFMHISPSAVFRLLIDADMRGVIMFLILSIFMSILRTWRYGIILKVSGYSPFSIALFLVVLVRNFFSDLLPARIGTLVYIYIITTRLRVPFGAAASSFALSFIFDMIALAPLIAVALLFAGVSQVISWMQLLTLVVLLAIVLLIILYKLPVLCHWSSRLLLRAIYLSEKRRIKWSDSLAIVGQEISKAREAGIYGRLLVLSLLVRCAKYGALYMFLFALLNPLKYGFNELNLPRVFLGFTVSEFVASTPISGIAGFGAYEGAWSVIFELLGFPGNIAKLTSISHHLFTQAYGYSLGALALVILMLPIFKPKRDAEKKSYPIGDSLAFWIRAAASVTIVLAGLWVCYQIPSASGAQNETTADKPTREEVESRRKLAKKFPGTLLFDSNRGGTFGIYAMKPDGSKLRVIVDTKWDDMYPDPSPDGKWIVYTQARSPKRMAPSDIWICRTNGTENRKVADNGIFPTFSGDGKTIYFEREPNKVMAVDVDGMNERELFPLDNDSFARYRVAKPRLSSDGRYVAFLANRPYAWNAWFADLQTGKSFLVGDGCEPAWFPDGRYIAWIKQKGTLDRTGIYKFDTMTKRSDKLQDDGPPRGHEYFPSITTDGRYLLYSSSRENEHSHENANYQIFIKDMEEGTIVRVTFDEFTNRWPKLLPR